MTSPPPTERNRLLVLEAVSRFSAGDIASLIELLCEEFVSHNPRVAHDPAAQSGRQAFANYLSGPGSAHLRDATVAAVDLFRVDGGRLVEHWDVIQPIPEEVLHPHGMF
jgi:predicted SnoaL-like aldol condensation-catalyzing enzyme